MINYKNELLVTKEIVAVLEEFTKITTLKKLLHAFSFEDNNVSDRLVNSNEKYNSMFSPCGSIDDDIWAFTHQFLAKLNRDSKMALYVFVLNTHYDHFEEEFLGTDASLGLDENNLDKEFGRFLAGKIYEPKNTELEHMVIEHLKGTLIIFSTEFDLSLIDENTIEIINNTIDDYTY